MMDFNQVPIIAGALFGAMFLLMCICCLARVCASQSRSQSSTQYVNTTAVGHTTVADINTQFNYPVAASVPHYSVGAGEHFPIHPGHPHPPSYGHDFQQQHHNFTMGPVSSFASATAPPTDAPPSYREVVGNPNNAYCG